MECRLLHLCLMAVILLGGSYAYAHGRYDYDRYRQPEPRYGPSYRDYYRPAPREYYRGYRDHQREDSSSEDDDHESEEEHHEEEKHEIYRFQISDDFEAYAYVDDHGHTKGFLIDLLHAVCDRAHKECYYMVDANSHCWKTDGDRELPGVGLMDHYYDGCLGYWQSSGRRNSFNFSLPFTVDVTASLHFKAGAKVENPTQVTGKKIGFVAGWPISKKCFEHQSGFTGNEPGKYTPVVFEDHNLLVDGLQGDEVDAILTVDSYKDEPLGLQHGGPRFHCTEAGASVMTMYGSDVLEWWNQAFLDMKLDGSFRRLCQTASRVHASHGEIRCVH